MRSRVGNPVRQVARTVADLGARLHLPGLGDRSRATPRTPGAPPGIEHVAAATTPPAPDVLDIECIDYSDQRIERRQIDDLQAFLQETKPEWVKVRWLNVDGLHPWAIDQLRRAYQLHTLAAEDVLHVPQRPRVEGYRQHVFVVMRMVMRDGEALMSEQVSMFLKDGLVLTFQEHPGDVWAPIRKRLDDPGSLVRQGSADYLLYALTDSVVDHCFPLLEHYGEELEQLEDEIMARPGPAMLKRVHQVRRELLSLRRILFPTRELADQLYRWEGKELGGRTKTFLRDVHAHTIQLLDILEYQRETCGALTELSMSLVSNRMNEVMKVLTIMATLFIPVTFIAGVYGMNFEHIPELRWRYAYFGFWAICGLVTSGLLIFFWRRGWLGGDHT